MAVVKKRPLVRIKVLQISNNLHYRVLAENLHNTLERVVPTKGYYVSTSLKKKSRIRQKIKLVCTTKVKKEY